MSKTLSEGDAAPDFTLPASGGMEIRLKDLKGKKVVLFFYPKADTPGCTQESIEFSRLKGDFAKAGTEVLGASSDPVKAQDKFTDKYELCTPLLSDEQHGMLEDYGVWGEKSMYGKTFMGIERSTFLIDENGRLARIWRKVKVEGHAAEVLEAARSL
ncbi:MAG: thioredoxin-dependent thiol peroxidase [Pseudomonadota bacterium]